MSQKFYPVKAPFASVTALPFEPDTILDGTNPKARSAKVLLSLDGLASAFVWECTPGKIIVDYDQDETIYVIEGSVIVDEGLPTERRIQAGDIVFFPAGTHVHWTVQTFFRKVVFRRRAMPRRFLGIMNLIRRVKNWRSAPPKTLLDQVS